MGVLCLIHGCISCPLPTTNPRSLLYSVNFVEWMDDNEKFRFNSVVTLSGFSIPSGSLATLRFLSSPWSLPRNQIFSFE